MPHYMMGDNSSQKSHSSGSGYPMPTDPGGGGYHQHHHPSSNGHHSDGASPGSSQLSVDGGGGGRESTLITRTQKQHVTQNVTTTTRTIKEVTYLGPDGQPIDYLPSHMPPMLHYDHNDYQNQHFGEYQHYGDYGRPPTPPTPSERSTSPLPDRRQSDYLRGQQSVGGYPPLRSGYDELDTTLMPPRGGLGGPLPDQYRNSPSPGVGGGHPGYAGGYHHSSSSSSPPLPHHHPQQPFLPPRSSVSSLTGGGGRSSVAADPQQQQQHYHPQQQLQHSSGYTSPSHQQYPHPHHLNAYEEDDDEDLYGQQQQHNNYSNYDPHLINNNNNHLNHTLDNSVFKDNTSTDGGAYPGEYPVGGAMLQLAPREAPRAVFDEDDQEPRPLGGSRGPGAHHPSQHPGMSSMPGVQWRDPDLHEVIEFLSNPNSVIKANAAAYLQHLCYMDDPVKAKTRQLGGIPPLVALLSHEIPDIHKNACGALRNLSYGRQNDENKRAIKAAGGTNALVRLLRKTADNDVKELVTGVLWNLSSCDDLKRTIIDEALLVIVNIVIIPHSGWDRGASGQGGDTHWSTVFRNASGILRNVSSAGDYGRKKLRECEGLVDALLYLVRNAIERANIDNKSVENAVCVLRNLSYRAQEIEDPNYDKRQLPVGETRAAAGKPGADAQSGGCFGASKTKPNKAGGSATSTTAGGSSQSGGRSGGGGPAAGMDLLWQPEVVQPYLNLLSNCSNPETLEAAAGAIQNLSACYWQPSIDIRAAVRKEKGLPILVELLRMEVDRVVCAVATALRNLAIDQRNKELIGKYAMRDLVQKLPSGNPQRDVGTSDDTIAAVLATLNEVIKKHPEFSRSLLEAGGVDRLMNITRQRSKYTSRVVKFASQVLFSMWQHQELREVYRKSGWKETDFVTKTVAARNARPNSPTHLNSTLNRPMASQGGTRYEDRTMGRAAGAAAVAAGGHPHNNGAIQQQQYHAESIPLENMSLYGGGGGGGGGRMYPPGQHMVRPGEPVYAQVNRDRKRSAKGGPDGLGGGPDNMDYSDRHWTMQPQQQQQQQQQPAPPAGDSWV